MGLCQVRVAAAYCWCSEFMTTEYKPRSYLAINLYDALPLPLLCLYFVYISKSWVYINIVVLIIQMISLLICAFLPESPKWHLINGRTPEAIKILNKIAEVNGSPHRIPESATFIEDPTNFSNAEKILGGNVKNYESVN